MVWHAYQSFQLILPLARDAKVWNVDFMHAIYHWTMALNKYFLVSGGLLWATVLTLNYNWSQLQAIILFIPISPSFLFLLLVWMGKVCMLSFFPLICGCICTDEKYSQGEKKKTPKTKLRNKNCNGIVLFSWLSSEMQIRNIYKMNVMYSTVQKS